MTKRKSGDYDGSKGTQPLVQGASHKKVNTTRADVVDEKRTHLSKSKEEEPLNLFWKPVLPLVGKRQDLSVMERALRRNRDRVNGGEEGY
jgi:hypothetical protein